jgi:signal transduction histidine kinase
MSSKVLTQHPERLDERRELAVRIERNIDRTDRMIRDLLDANRIRAGEKLPLRIDECDLAVVAQEV